MGAFRDKLERGEFVVTSEVAPPRGTDYTKMRATVATLAPVSDAVNITDNQGATLHLSSLAASRITLEDGVEPIFQQTCRDRNRLALQSDLLAAWSLGLENVLIVSGDNPHSGDHPQAKGVFDLDSTQLLQVVTQMNNGTDMNGNPLDGDPTNFYIGAAAFPEAEPWEFQLARIEEKVAAGAVFFQTQAIMDMELFAKRLEDLKQFGVKLIPGILLLKSLRVINFINTRLPGLTVPPHLEARIAAAEDPMEEAIQIAIEQAKVCREIADGVHIMPLGSNQAAVRILKESGIR